jgi:hypothetical protein
LVWDLLGKRGPATAVYGDLSSPSSGDDWKGTRRVVSGLFRFVSHGQLFLMITSVSCFGFVLLQKKLFWTHGFFESVGFLIPTHVFEASDLRIFMDFSYVYVFLFKKDCPTMRTRFSGLPHALCWFRSVSRGGFDEEQCSIFLYPKKIFKLSQFFLLPELKFNNHLWNL